MRLPAGTERLRRRSLPGSTVVTELCVPSTLRPLPRAGKAGELSEALFHRHYANRTVRTRAGTIFLPAALANTCPSRTANALGETVPVPENNKLTVK